MLFDPIILIDAPGKVLGVLALVIVGKGAIEFLIVIALRYPVNMAFGIAARLSQIGEFSFILAGSRHLPRTGVGRSQGSHPRRRNTCRSR